MRVLVCGGRDFRDENKLFVELDLIHTMTPISCIIEGGQRTRDIHTREIVGGADYWANQWAKKRGISCETFKADWDREGLRAGPIRNQHMIDAGKPDLVVAFFGGKGTADMVRRAMLAQITTIKVG